MIILKKLATFHGNRFIWNVIIYHASEIENKKDTLDNNEQITIYY